MAYYLSTILLKCIVGLHQHTGYTSVFLDKMERLNTYCTIQLIGFGNPMDLTDRVGTSGVSLEFMY